MKKKITTLLVALSIVGISIAQQSGCPAKMGAQSRILSQCVEGDYTLTRYLVKETSPDNDEFSVRYKINISKLISSYDSNAEEIKSLRSFIAQLQQDTLKQITTVNVTGFASPDGPASINAKLAMERAQDFRQYINKNCGMASYKGTTKADALEWSDAAKIIEGSSIPNRAAVLDIIHSNNAAAAIEAKLKGMPQAWSYLKSEILPQMRCVEICVKYNSWKVVEVRTLNKGCAPQRQAPPATVNYFILIEDDTKGMIVNPSSTPIDYKEAKCRGRKSRREKIKLKAKRTHHREFLFERVRVR